MSEKDSESSTTTTFDASFEPVKPTFKDEFVFECVIQKSGEELELWHNPVTGAYETRPLGSSKTAAEAAASNEGAA